VTHHVPGMAAGPRPGTWRRSWSRGSGSGTVAVAGVPAAVGSADRV